jgi:membrane fusion protein, multidrug efflux system
MNPTVHTENHAAAQDADQPKSVLQRVVKALMMVALVTGGVVFGMYKMRVNIPALNTAKIYEHIDSMAVRAEHMKGYVVGQYESHFGKHEAEVHHEEHKVVVTSPLAQDVDITQEYVCQIHSRRHINVCALESGYLEAIPVREGQAVKTDEKLFSVKSILYKARLDAETAERDVVEQEYNNTKALYERQGVSDKEVRLFKARLARAQAKMDLAKAEFDFATVKAPFDGIIDKLQEQEGSLVKEGDVLTTLSDNGVMWVYFNVTEKRYLEYMAETGHNKQSPDIELMLANHDKFPQIGKIGAIEANFNNETGNISFRADFANPDSLLRHGQTGTVRIKRALRGAIVIPQRATFENLAKRYVYVVGEDETVHQKEIVIEHELEDIFVIKSGILNAKNRIVLEGIRQVREGEKLEEPEFRKPEDVIKNAKNTAE